MSNLTSTENLLFAGDCALNATSGADLYNSVHRFSKACSNFGLKRIRQKTSTNQLLAKPMLNQLDGVKLKVFNRFTDLDSTLSQNVNINNEVITAISDLWQTICKCLVSKRH